MLHEQKGKIADVSHNKLKLNYLVFKYNIYKYLQNDRNDKDNDYFRKIIHIIPNNNFTDKNIFLP